MWFDFVEELRKNSRDWVPEETQNPNTLRAWICKSEVQLGII